MYIYVSLLYLTMTNIIDDVMIFSYCSSFIHCENISFSSPSRQREITFEKVLKISRAHPKRWGFQYFSVKIGIHKLTANFL